MLSLVLVAHDIRSAHNIGSLIRTAEGLGVSRLFITGYSPYPAAPDDSRLPHIAGKITARIHKTSLGAEDSLDWAYRQDVTKVIHRLKTEGYTIAGLEQAAGAISLVEFDPPSKIALIVGSEVGGLSREVLVLCDKIIEIPMAGNKESFNVAVAAGMALFHLMTDVSKA
jgi:tRNA G18 (ribose-2'-O)-methylase SpoU